MIPTADTFMLFYLIVAITLLALAIVAYVGTEHERKGQRKSK